MAASRFNNWKYIFLVFGILTILSGLWLMWTPITEKPVKSTSSSFAASFGLLKDKTILMLFLGILFVVGVDVGLNTTIPKFLIEKCSIPLDQAGLGTSLYFVARTVGTFLGAILLFRLSARKFFITSMFVAIPVLLVMLFISNLWAILVMVFILGFAVANVFSIIFSAALRTMPENANEISGLMIMGVTGGAIIPLIMGVFSDLYGQAGGLAVLLAALAYLLFSAYKISD
jgi:fucose permease